MSGKSWTVLIVVNLLACVAVTLCSVTAYLGYRAMSPREASSGANASLEAESQGQAGLREGGTLRLAGDPPPTLDPALIQDSTSAEYAIHLFSGLVSLDADLEVTPDLAERWDISPDGRTYTFALRPDAVFQSGRAITAEDIVYSLERACSPALASPVASVYLDDIVGVSEFAQGQAEHIQGLGVVDDHTLEIRIDAPKAYFLAKLTYPTALVVNREQVESQGEAWWRKPDGSGPFVLDTLTDDRIVLVRNPRYYGGPAALERVEFTLSGGLPITMYENNRLDIVEVDPSEIERVLDPENPLYAEHRAMPELSVDYLGLNTMAPPFDDLAVRQAFAMAIDKDKLADLVLKGTALPARGILPPGMPGYDASYEGLPYDPARARELLAGSRYGAPGAMPEIALAISGTSAQMPPLVRAITSMIRENLGIEMIVEQVEWPDFLNDMNLYRYQIFSAGWIADYPDPQNFLDILFHSASLQNSTGYRNAQVDDLLARARVEGDHAKRMALYNEAERIIVSEAPWIPLTHGVTHVLVKPYVSGYQASASLYPWLKDIALTP